MADVNTTDKGNATGVFWDVDECEIPDELSAPEALQSLLLDQGHRGLSQSELMERNVTKILEDIVSWSGENPEPSVGMLVVGDAGDDIVEVVRLLKSQKNYKFMLVSPGSSPPTPPPPTVMTAIPRGGL